MMMMIKLRVNHVMLYFYAKVVQCTTSVGERFLFFVFLYLSLSLSLYLCINRLNGNVAERTRLLSKQELIMSRVFTFSTVSVTLSYI